MQYFKKVTIALVCILFSFLGTCCNNDGVSSKTLIELIKANDLVAVENMLQQSTESINELDSKIPIIAEKMDGNVRYPLQWACDLGNYEMVKLLLNYGADVNLGEPTPLTMALVRTSNVERFKIAELLINNGAKMVIVSDGSWHNPLSSSLRLSDNASEDEKENSYVIFLSILQEYERNNLNIRNEKYNSGDNILTLAAREKNLLALQYLIENEYYSINDTNEYGRNAICSVAFDSWRNSDSRRITEYLLDLGADPYFQDSNGLSAYDYALKNKNDIMIDVLEKYKN